MRITSATCCPRRLRSYCWQCQQLLFTVLLTALTSVGRSDDDVISVARFDKPDAEPFSLSYPIDAISFSPDGERVAVCGNTLTAPRGGAVALLESHDMRPLRTLRVGNVFRLDFSNDGRLLALGGAFDAAIWRIEEGMLDLLDEGPLTVPYYRPICGDCYVRFMAKDSRLLLLDGQGGGLHFWSISPRRMGLPITPDDPELESFREMDVSPDENVVAVGCDGRAVGVFRLETGGLGELLWQRRANFKMQAQFPGSVFFCIKFSPDGKRLGILMYEGLKGSLELWARHDAGNEASDWKLEGTLVGGDEDQEFVFGRKFAFSPDGKYIAVCGSEESGVGIFDVNGRRLISRLQYTAWTYNRRDTDLSSELDPDADESASVVPRVDRPFVKALAFSPDGKVLLTGYESGEVALWQFQSKVAEIQAN